MGLRLPFQIPHDTPEDCREPGLTPRTTAESAAERIRDRPRPAVAAVVVLGDTAYDAEVVPPACRERGDIGIVPAHPERVAKGPPGHRPPGVPVCRGLNPRRLRAAVTDTVVDAESHCPAASARR